VLAEEADMPTPSGHTTAILGSKVIGTPVFAAEGRKIGHVQDILLDKLSDKLAFAVVASNSASEGKRYLPLPWALLDYHTDSQGYVIDLSEHQLKNAPAFSLDELTTDDALLARERVNQFYNSL
jgi:hypothetical protein